jgi:nitrate/nitrite sensing protein
MRSLTSLRAKLTVLVALPLLVLVVAAAVAANRAEQAATDAADTAHRIDLAVAASTAALQLAQERALSATTLEDAPAPAGAGSGTEPAEPAVSEALELQRNQTSQAVAVLRRAAGPAAGDAPLGSALQRLGRLDAARSTVDDGGDPSDVLDSYAQIIDPVLDFDETLADVDDPALITGISSHEALTRAIQDAAMEQALLTPVFASGHVDAGTYQQLLGVVTTQDLWLGLFQDKASGEQRHGYEELATVPAVATVQRLREQVLSAGPAGTVHADADAWAEATSRKLDLLEGVAQDAAEQLTAGAARAEADAGRARTRALGLAGGALLLAAAVLALLWRFVLQPFGRHVSATELALADGTGVAVPTDSELGALASAFNQAQESAYLAACDAAEATQAVEAAEDRVDDSVYLTFGRRTQDLISEQLRHIDELESRTEDPDTLADLFLLDHLATRLRRNAESQVVVAGADSPRPWARPVSVTNVVRAAAAEASDYSRVEVQPMPPASIAGSAANDVSHLLAELIDESLAVLPGHLRVVIGGARQRDGGYVVAVSGVGQRLAPVEVDAVNDLLAWSDDDRWADSTAARPGDELDQDLLFRFFVVAQLARRHDIRVYLGQAPGGTIAEIDLPPATLVDGTAADPGVPASPATATATATATAALAAATDDGGASVLGGAVAEAAPYPPAPPYLPSPAPPAISPPALAGSSPPTTVDRDDGPVAGGQLSPISRLMAPASRRRRGAHAAALPAVDETDRTPRFLRRRRRVTAWMSSRRSVDPWTEWQRDG